MHKDTDSLHLVRHERSHCEMTLRSCRLRHINAMLHFTHLCFQARMFVESHLAPHPRL